MDKTNYQDEVERKLDAIIEEIAETNAILREALNED